MDIEQFRDYCLEKEGSVEEFPFGPNTLVFKVFNKIFALTSLDNPEFKVNLKCEPNYAEDLRSKHTEIIPGFHMNKKHWNTVNFQGNLSDTLLKHLIDHSYQKVIDSLPKSKKLK